MERLPPPARHDQVQPRWVRQAEDSEVGRGERRADDGDGFREHTLVGAVGVELARRVRQGGGAGEEEGGAREGEGQLGQQKLVQEGRRRVTRLTSNDDMKHDCVGWVWICQA